MQRRDFLEKLCQTFGLMSAPGSAIWAVLSEMPAYSQSCQGACVSGEFYSKCTQGSTEVIYGTDVTLDPSQTAQGQDLVVYADTLSISGSFKLYQTNIRLFARNIIAAPGTTMDVSGQTGTPDYQPGNRAGGGPSTGAQGQPGAVGGDGGNSGNIEIWVGSLSGNLTLTANGGHGGRGQDGGNGAGGGIGGEGQTGNESHRQGFPGGKGQTGGLRGVGGTGGRGGKAGSIQFNFLDPASVRPNMNSAPGAGGDGGSEGGPGTGGPGGPGGHSVTCHENGNHGGSGPTTCYQNGDRGPTGPQGDSPDLPHFIASGGAPGGTSSPTASQITAAVLGRVGSITHVLMVFRKATLSYISATPDNLAKTTDYLSWLLSISSGSDAFSKPLDPNATIPLDAERSAFQTRLSALSTQIHSGLDYYGLPFDFVPLVALDVYDKLVSQMLDSAGSIEGAYNSYVSAKSCMEDRLGALNESLNRTNDAIQQLNTQLAQAQNDANAADTAQAQLLVNLQLQIADLQSANDAFQNAVKAKAQCTFIDTIRFISAVISVGTTTYDSISSIIAASKNLTQSFDVKNVIKTFQTVSNDVNQMKQAYGSIKDLIPKNDFSSRLVMTEDAVSAAVQPYLDLQEAQKYKSAVQLYLETAKDWNAKLVEYSAHVQNIAALQGEINQRNQEALRIGGKIAQTANPDLTDMVHFMQKVLDETKLAIVRVLSQENRALEYWSLDPKPFVVSNTDVASLKASHTLLQSNILAEMESRNSSGQSFKSEKFSLSEKQLPEQFDRFRKTGILTFNIDQQAFLKKYAAVTVSSVQIAIQGIKTGDGNLSVDLVHNGRAKFLRTTGQVVAFSHMRRPFTFKYSISKPGQMFTDDLLGGEFSKYAFLSPYASWTLTVADDSNVKLSRANIKEIDFTFSGFFLSTA